MAQRKNQLQPDRKGLLATRSFISPLYLLILLLQENALASISGLRRCFLPLSITSGSITAGGHLHEPVHLRGPVPSGAY